MNRTILHSLAAIIWGLTAIAQATIVTLDGIGLAANADLPLNFASNLAADMGGATVTNGATPNIALAWAPSPNVWEVHSSPHWDNLDAGSGTDVVQMDADGDIADPTIVFTVPPGVALQLNSLDIGHANDQTEPAYAWTLTVTELGGPTVLTNTTALLGPGDVDAVVFAFTGDPGKDYVLKFDDGGANTVRAAIDNLSFNQLGENFTAESLIVFNGMTDAVNTPVPVNFGSHLSASIPGALAANGGTPDIALTWSPTSPAPTRWELHGTAPFRALDPASGSGGITVGQLEKGGARTITFEAGERATLQLKNLDIGHASDQRTDGSEPPFAWTISLDEVDGTNVFTHHTAALHGAASDPSPKVERVHFDFTGERGKDYVLTFTPGGNGADYGLRAAIDNLRFAQLTAPLELHVAATDPALDFRWNSASGKRYDLLSSTDLSVPKSAWPVYDPDGPGGQDPFADIESAGALTTLTEVPRQGAGRLFAVVEKEPPLPPVMVVAHRGNSINTPENTLASIRTATLVADMTEFDVRATSDGALVLMHDATVDRTTDGSGAIASLSLAQAELLDAGSWFSAAFAGEGVPTLADALTEARSAGLVPVIERKAGSAAAYHAEFLAAGLDPEDVRVIAFDGAFLAALHALEPAYELGFLSSAAFTQGAIDQAKVNGADFLNWNHADINQASVALAHANGMPLFVWTVNDAARMQALIGFGINGITTDNPALLRSLLP